MVADYELRQFLMKSSNISIFGLPSWIRHFEFLKSKFRFVIRDPENSKTPI